MSFIALFGFRVELILESGVIPEDGFILVFYLDDYPRNYQYYSYQDYPFQ